MTQVSIPNFLTSLTAWHTISKTSFVGHLPDDPIQNRLLPIDFAFFAASIIVFMSVIICFGSFVLFFMDCAQYAQSSEHPPVCILRSVFNCISLGFFEYFLWIVWA